MNRIHRRCPTIRAIWSAALTAALCAPEWGLLWLPLAVLLIVLGVRG